MSKIIKLGITFANCSRLFLDATKITIPAANGYMTILPNHIPVLAYLNPGTLTVHTLNGQFPEQFDVSSGFFRFHNNKSSILLQEKLEMRKVS